MRLLGVLSFLAAVAICAVMTRAATINVGPARTYTTVQDGINAARPGDTVLLDEVTFTGASAAASIGTDNLTIKGGAGTVLDFNNLGTGLVVQNTVTTVTFDSLEGKNTSTDGCIVSSAGGTTTINNCVLHDCYRGLRVIGGATFGATAMVTNCHIYNDNAANGGSAPLNNVHANVKSLTMKGCWIHNSINYGVKTWAKYNYFLYNRMGDEQGWAGNNGGCAIDCVYGGLTYIIGNTFQWATGSRNGLHMIYYRDTNQYAAGYSTQVYAVYNTILAHRGQSQTWLVLSAGGGTTPITVPAYVANNVFIHDGQGTLVNGPVVDNSAMMTSNLQLYDCHGGNPPAMHRYMYDANGFDGDGNSGTTSAYETWDALNVRPVDPNMFPNGAGSSNSASLFPLATGNQTLLSPSTPVLLPGSNPQALPAAGDDGTSLTPTSQFVPMPQGAGPCGTENRDNAADAAGAYCFAVPAPPGPHISIEPLPPYVYEGWTVQLTATVTDIPQGMILSYQWVQTAGQSQTLTGATTPSASFTVPSRSLTSLADQTLAFQFSATEGGTSARSSLPLNMSTTCYLCGDVDHDQAVILADLKMLVASWNATPASGNWNQVADLDGDQAIILADLKLLVSNWNRSLR